MNQNQKQNIIQLRSQGLGYTKIANALNLSVNTVKSFCRRNNVITGKGVVEFVKNNMNLSSCEQCGKAIQQVHGRKLKRFCCDKCRNQWWNSHLHLVERKATYKCQCLNCQKIFDVYGNKTRKYCSHECYISHRFGGGYELNELR